MGSEPETDCKHHASFERRGPSSKSSLLSSICSGSGILCKVGGLGDWGCRAEYPETTSAKNLQLICPPHLREFVGNPVVFDVFWHEGLSDLWKAAPEIRQPPQTLHLPEREGSIHVQYASDGISMWPLNILGSQL